LFTLVGIAGEDNLDAPDLTTPTVLTSKGDKPAENKIAHLNGGQVHSTQKLSSGRPAKAVSNPRKPMLESLASASLRDQLTAELKDLSSAGDGANWARQKHPDHGRCRAR